MKRLPLLIAAALLASACLFPQSKVPPVNLPPGVEPLQFDPVSLPINRATNPPTVSAKASAAAKARHVVIHATAGQTAVVIPDANYIPETLIVARAVILDCSDPLDCTITGTNIALATPIAGTVHLYYWVP